MSDEFERIWSSLYPVWIKYCGVCDEYKNLKDKWNYFCVEEFSSLPSIYPTFQRVDTLIEETNHIFSPFFGRERIDSMNGFDRELASRRISEFQNRFMELSNYLGILKFIFFQRTVSSEIPHMVSGEPISPERTIGNEMLYIAADNIARQYRNCVRLDQNLNWDGIISFIYPIQSDYFFGGFCHPSNYLKHFHVSISEEGKHFLGTYLLLAHEISHAIHYKWDGALRSFRCPSWFATIWREILGRQLTLFPPLLEQLKESCSECHYYDYLFTYMYDLRENSEMFRQFVADLLACLIGGPTTCYSLIDMFLNANPELRHIPLRPAFICGYFQQKHELAASAVLENEISDMQNKWTPHIQRIQSLVRSSCILDGADPSRMCFPIFMEMGRHAGHVFADCDEQLVDLYRMLEFPIEPPSVPEEFDSISSMLVRDRFDISAQEEAEIECKLKNRTICSDYDPRKILHCYYISHRKGQTPDYAATLASLASCQF
ncbi:MAG: hypothetical protein OEW62_01220 [Candidatus Bathyarchaeota archaeon]|nr:hypothetical protein [Candidatus Bathyarchaeota archaeon]MDH5595212.1 hypothetical protein [Candidatus Bathyarchaeota archaeon]